MLDLIGVSDLVKRAKPLAGQSVSTFELKI